MSDEALHNVFSRARLDDRQINELIGICRGVAADDVVNAQEASFLQSWLAGHAAVTANPVVCNLLQHISVHLRDGALNQEERKELAETLARFTGEKVELGEVLKATTLPLDSPPPEVTFPGSQFCFTGTFAYGTRRDCEQAVEKLGGRAGSLTQKTNYLVVGVYATDSWMHSSYGQKIEHALQMKTKGVPIAIIGESHWKTGFKQA